MLCMCAGGCLWNAATSGHKNFDDLIEGWSKWYSINGADATPTETNYPKVAFFDSHIDPPYLRKMLLSMLNPNPSKRMTIAAAVKKPWMKNAECCQVDSYDDPTIVIDASKASCAKKSCKVVHHNHLPPQTHMGHKLVRIPGGNDM